VYRDQAGWGQNPFARTDWADNLVAGGPHIGLTSSWALGQSGWVVFGRADGAVSFGDRTVRQDFQPSQPDPWGQLVPRSDRSSFGASQFDLSLQLGFGRRWQWRDWDVGLTAGIQADALSVANLRGAFVAAGLVNVGPFLRWEINF
jgi:hypothetical protein